VGSFESCVMSANQSLPERSFQYYEQFASAGGQSAWG